jgi:hypothetical protein
MMGTYDTHQMQNSKELDEGAFDAELDDEDEILLDAHQIQTFQE